MLNKLTDNQMLLDQVMLLLTGGLCQESVVLDAALLGLKPRQGTSISNVIWILSSDNICQLNHLFSNSEAALLGLKLADLLAVFF